MPQDIHTALNLLLIGITMVFLILFLIIAAGYFLIIFSNRFIISQTDKFIKLNEKSDIGKKYIAAIATTVEIVTSGKGKIENIKRITDQNIFSP